jgi:hypothetical protein
MIGYTTNNSNKHNIFSRSGATHGHRAATKPVCCADEMGRCQRQPFLMVVVQDDE